MPPKSLYPGLYIFTHEQLEALLDDVLDEVRWRRLATGEDCGAYGLTDMAWPKVCAAVIAETLDTLAFDATRPLSCEARASCSTCGKTGENRVCSNPFHLSPPRPVCPQCHGPLLALTWSSQSLLNRDQWASQRTGDFLCRTCPDNGRGEQPFAFFWRREVEGPHA